MIDKFAIRVRAGYTAAFILLIVSYLIILYANRQLINQSIWVNQSGRTIDNLEKTLSGLKDAETGLRGFIITKDTSTLLPYKNSFVIVNKSFNELNAAIKEDDFQKAKLVTLKLMIDKRYSRLDSTRYFFVNNDYAINNTVISSILTGKYYMDSTRAIVTSMQLHERELMLSKNKELDAKQKALKSIIIASLILAIVFIIFGFFTFSKENKAKQQAEKISEDYQQELKQRIAELDNANKKLIELKGSEKFAATGRIARIIAHEVRNPLTNINLAVSQIKADLPNLDETATMLFAMVTRNSERINVLIGDLLNATRFEELNYNEFSINTLLDEALNLVEDSIVLNQIKIEKHYSTDICNISADPEKIKIALVNIIVNAIEAVEPGKGIVEIVTKGENDKCVIEIKDNGSGMTEDELNRLFEPYFTSKQKGNGLGLTNTQNIILNHQGAIYVKSKPGQGTTFTVKFDFTKP
jgi:signal transduction histidine kinase